MPRRRPHEVAVFGATGYTGHQIVRELVDAGHDVVCVGRDHAKLQALASRHGWPAQVEAVDFTDRARLKFLCAQATTVVNAAGSFVETCEPVARAAIAAGAHYLDISGEQQSIRFAMDDLDKPAAAAGVVVVPSAAFYAALADSLVALVAADLDHVDAIDIAYHITGWIPSGAAYANFLRGMGQPIIQFDRGFIDMAMPAYRVTDFGRPLGRLPTFTYPAPEVLTIPRHIEVDRIDTAMSASSFKTAVPARFVPGMTRVIGRALASPAAPIVEKILSATTGSSVERVQEDPTNFRIAVRLTANDVARTATLDARGIFDITAPIAARIAHLTLADTFHRAGALTPAQMVRNPGEFLDTLADYQVSYAISGSTPASAGGG